MNALKMIIIEIFSNFLFSTI